MSVQIAVFEEEHLEAAAALVSGRYRTLREHVPLLPSRYEQADTALSMLRDLVGHAPGVVAIRDGRLVGLLAGFVIPAFLGKQALYSPEWANGAEPGMSRRVYEDMYAVASAQWVAAGCLTHVVTLLAHDSEGLQGWQWLGFGHAAVDGLRAVERVECSVPAVEIRRAGIEHVEEAVAFDEALTRHLTAAPTFWMHEPQDCEAWLSDPANALWLAYEGGEAVGSMGIGPASADACTIIQDGKTASIVSAFTEERARGKGIAAALLNRSLEWARAEGYERCAVDFEAMNVLAARFWTRWFEPVCYSLLRCIDERIGRGLGG